MGQGLQQNTNKAPGGLSTHNAPPAKPTPKPSSSELSARQKSIKDIIAKHAPVVGDFLLNTLYGERSSNRPRVHMNIGVLTDAHIQGLKDYYTLKKESIDYLSELLGDLEKKLRLRGAVKATVENPLASQDTKYLAADISKIYNYRSQSFQTFINSALNDKRYSDLTKLIQSEKKGDDQASNLKFHIAQMILGDLQYPLTSNSESSDIAAINGRLAIYKRDIDLIISGIVELDAIKRIVNNSKIKGVTSYHESMTTEALSDYYTAKSGITKSIRTEIQAKNDVNAKERIKTRLGINVSNKDGVVQIDTLEANSILKDARFKNGTTVKDASGLFGTIATAYQIVSVIDGAEVIHIDNVTTLAAILARKSKDAELTLLIGNTPADNPGVLRNATVHVSKTQSELARLPEAVRNQKLAYYDNKIIKVKLNN